ncbi:MAG: SRPBCC family protein [Solirubrobacterales bacterium]
MSSWRHQALIDAPVKEVWALLEDPAGYPDWNSDTVAVTGTPTAIETGSSFEVTGRGPMGMKTTTKYKVESREELRELRMRCQRTGYYSRWLLTPAQGGTFTEVELGVERTPSLNGRIAEAIHTKGYLRRAAEETLDNLRSALARDTAR